LHCASDWPHKRFVLRRVDPEILDSLSADDPEAIGSRRDLRWINAIMGNYRWLHRRVRSHIQPGWRVLELGAGEGIFGRRLAHAGQISPEQIIALDLAPCPDTWPTGAMWIQEDVFSQPLPAAEIIVANLFLHHFTAERLTQLGRLLPSSCRYLAISEPARHPLHLWQGSLLAALARLNRVTRHDMPVSIRAGFMGNELPEWLGISDWKIKTSTTFFGAYRLEAHRT
jgi:hypothetical protein